MRGKSVLQALLSHIRRLAFSERRAVSLLGELQNQSSDLAHWTDEVRRSHDQLSRLVDIGCLLGEPVVTGGAAEEVESRKELTFEESIQELCHLVEEQLSEYEQAKMLAELSEQWDVARLIRLGLNEKIDLEERVTDFMQSRAA